MRHREPDWVATLLMLLGLTLGIVGVALVVVALVWGL